MEIEKTELEKAQQLLDDEKKIRTENCGKKVLEAISSICVEYNCTMEIAGEFEGNNIVCNLLFKPKR